MTMRFLRAALALVIVVAVYVGQASAAAKAAKGFQPDHQTQGRGSLQGQGHGGSQLGQGRGGSQPSQGEGSFQRGSPFEQPPFQQPPPFQQSPQTGTGVAVAAQGVVQSISSTSVTVRQLDGTTVAVPVGRQTAVYIDGKSARLGAARPGDVLVASWTSGQPATVLRFYSTS
jgi:hypothetical protein